MRIPVPNNRLVAFTLVGALLTTLVAAGLAFPGLGVVSDAPGEATEDGGVSQEVAADAPEPNEDFTPAVQTESTYEEHEEEEEYEDEEHEKEEEYEDEEHEKEEEYEDEEHEKEEYEDHEEEYEEEGYEDEEHEEYDD